MSGFRKQVSFGLIGRLLTATIGLVGTIIIARMTDPAVYGLFFFIYGVADVMNNPFAGWVAGCRKRITESNTDEGEIMGAFFLVVGLFTVILIIALGIFGVLRPSGKVGRNWQLIGVMFVGLVFFQLPGTILNVRDNFGYQSWVDYAKTVLKYIFQITFVWMGLQVGGLIVGTFLSMVLISPWIFYLIGVRPSFPSRDTLVSIWEFAKPKIPNSLLGTMLGRIDTLLLGFLATNAMVGYYNVALRVSAPAVFLTAIISGGTFGDVSSKSSAGEEFVGRIRQSLSYVSVLSIPILFGALVMSHEILVTAYSSKYAPAAPFLVFIGLYRVLRTQETVLGSVINGMDMPWESFRLGIVEFGSNIILSVGLFFVMGPIGIVVGSAMAQLAVYLGSVYIVRREVPSAPIITRPFLEQLLSGGLMAIALEGILQTRRPQSWVEIGVYVGIGGIIYVGSLLALSDGHRKTAWNVVGDWV